MKKFYPYVVLLLIFISCKKQDLHSPQQPEEKPDFIELPTPPKPPADRVQSGENVIFLDYDGQGVYDLNWSNSLILAAPCTKSVDVQNQITDMVKERYSTLNVIVTTDSNVYWGANQYRRIRCIITPTYQWYGSTGGVAFTNSATWGINEVCWAFENSYALTASDLAYRVSHEVGHTWGLYHQCVYNQSCQITSTYRGLTGSGATSYAPIMGTAYNAGLWTFTVGLDIRNCTVPVDEYAELNTASDGSGALLTNKPDLIANDMTSDEALVNNTPITYSLEYPTDVDFLRIPTHMGFGATYFTVTTYGTTDIALDVYDTNGSYRGSIDPSTSTDIPRTGAGGVLGGGYIVKWVAVRNTTNNPNVPAGSLRGSYTITASW